MVDIDEIDGRMLTLFLERMKVSGDIGRYKAENNMSAVNKLREREILARVSKDSGEDMERYSRVLFNTLFELSRSYQTSIAMGETELSGEIRRALLNTDKMFPEKGVVACQGTEGAYSQIACDKLFSYANIMYFKSFEGVFQAVEKGLCEYGILPIENSSYGTVNEVYDLMKNFKFHIIRSLKLLINHSLLGLPGVKIGDIKEIYSHEQALGQCSGFLKSLPNVKITVCENTAEAAKMVSESGRRDAAAISSHECAELYGLAVIDDKIQISDNNYTRFICISKDMRIFPGAGKISLMLSVPHKPGALYSMISKFSALGINLTKLESRPIPGKDFEFMFYFDMEASVYSEDVIKLLSELSQGSDLFVLLGIYSEA